MAGKAPPPVGLGSLAIPGFNLIPRRRTTKPTPQGSLPKSGTTASATAAATPGPANSEGGTAAPAGPPAVAANAAAALAAAALASPALGGTASPEEKADKKDKILKPVWLRFGFNPAHADVIDDTFTITSSDGSYSKTKSVADDKIPGDAYLDLEYEDLDISLDYSLKVDPGSSGEPYFLFKDVPYTALAAVKPSSN